MAHSPAPGRASGQAPHHLTDQLAQLLEALPVAALLTDENGTILHCNPLCAQLLHASGQQLRGAVISPLPAKGGPVTGAGLVRVYEGEAETGPPGGNVRIHGVAQRVGDHHVLLMTGATSPPSSSGSELREFLEGAECPQSPAHPLPRETVAVPIRPGVPSGLVVRVETQEGLSLLVRYYRGAPVCVAAGEVLSTVRTVAELAGENFPLVLIGPRGAGKRMLAHLVHFWSHRSTQPIGVLSAEHPIWSAASSPDSRENADRHPVLRRIEQIGRGTLVLHHAHRLPDQWLNWFRDAVEEHLTGVGDYPWNGLRCRVLVTAVEDELPQRSCWKDFVATLGVRLVEVPPLDRNAQLVPGLAAYFAFQFAFRFRSPVRVVQQDALDWLQNRRWPGGIRELRAAVYRACAACRGEELRIEHFGNEPCLSRVLGQGTDPIEDTLRAIEACGGNYRKAARLLGVSPSTVYRRLRRLRSQRG